MSDLPASHALTVSRCDEPAAAPDLGKVEVETGRYDAPNRADAYRYSVSA